MNGFQLQTHGKKRILGASALELLMWSDRIFLLAEVDRRRISLAVAKDLLYIEDAFEQKLFRMIPMVGELERLKEVEKPIAPKKKKPQFEETIFVPELKVENEPKKEKVIVPKEKKESVPKIKFYITATNFLKCVVAKFSIEADSKGEALKEAKEQAKSLPKSEKLTFKIS